MHLLKTMPILEREQPIEASRDEVFHFFSRAENLGIITPQWVHIEVLRPGVTMRPGTTIDYKIRLYGLPIRWQTVIESWDPPNGFVDRQIKGPYKVWRHTHLFQAMPDGRTLMRDRVEYQAPFGPIGRVIEALWVSRDVNRIFDYRSQAIERRFS